MFRKTIALIALACIPRSLSIAQSPGEIYEQRILPLLRSDSNRCAECHFGGMNLSDLFNEDANATYQNLLQLGWINRDEPEDSRLLSLIQQHTEEETKLQAQVREKEHSAIKTWLIAASKDPESLSHSITKHNDLALDEKVIRHTRIDQVEFRFIAAIWSQFERCAGCHSPDRNSKQVAKHGKQMTWIVPNSPAATLKLLTERGLIDLDDPSQSELRTKPAGITEHGAGVKFPENGETDSAWLAFLNDYAKAAKGEYKSAKELPDFKYVHRWRSGLRIKVNDIPKEWFGSIVNIFIFPVANGAAVSEPIAFGEAFVSEKRKTWSNSLELLSRSVGEESSTSNSPEVTQPITVADVMPVGKYLLSISPAGSGTRYQTIIEGPWEEGHSSWKDLSIHDMEMK